MLYKFLKSFNEKKKKKTLVKNDIFYLFFKNPSLFKILIKAVNLSRKKKESESDACFEKNK